MFLDRDLIVPPTVSEGTPPWAHTLLPLSRDPSRVKADLSTVPIKALTLLHLGALLDQATIELVRSPGCRSRGLEAERKRVLLLVNETPLFPYGPDYVDYNLQLGGRAAKRAASAQIKIFVVGFAPLEDRVAAELRQIAAITDGKYEAVSNE